MMDVSRVRCQDNKAHCSYNWKENINTDILYVLIWFYLNEFLLF